MKPKRIAFLLLFAIAALTIAGTKISRLTRTRSLQSNSVFVVVTGDVTKVTRAIEAQYLALELGRWITNQGSGGGGSGSVETQWFPDQSQFFTNASGIFVIKSIALLTNVSALNLTNRGNQLVIGWSTVQGLATNEAATYFNNTIDVNGTGTFGSLHSLGAVVGDAFFNKMQDLRITGGEGVPGTFAIFNSTSNLVGWISTNVIGFLNGATNALNTRVGNLEGATNGINTRVGNLEGATNGLNTAVGNLQGATNSLNTRTGNLDGATNGLNTAVGNLQGATNGLNTRVGNLEGATNGLTTRATALETRASNLEGATNGLNTRMANVEGATNGLNTRVQNLIGATNGMTTRLDNLEGGTNGLNSAMAQTLTNYLDLGGVSNATSKPLIFRKNNRMLEVWDLIAGPNIGLSMVSTGIVITSTGATLSDGDYGDVTVTASGATITIDNGVVTDAKLRQSQGFSVIGKFDTGTGVPADLVAGTDGVLRRNGSGNLAFGSLNTANYADDSVTAAKMENVLQDRILARASVGAGNVEQVPFSTSLTLAGGTFAPAPDFAISNLLTRHLSVTNSVQIGSTNTGSATNIALNWIGPSIITSYPSNTTFMVSFVSAPSGSNGFSKRLEHYIILTNAPTMVLPSGVSWVNPPVLIAGSQTTPSTNRLVYLFDGNTNVFGFSGQESNQLSGTFIVGSHITSSVFSNGVVYFTVFTNGVSVGTGTNINWTTGVTGYVSSGTFNLGAVATGGGGSGATNTPVLAAGFFDLTNQIFLRNGSFNGSNGTSGITLTNMLDFLLQTHKKTTNPIGTNVVWHGSNLTQGASAILTMRGLSGTTNTVAFRVPGGGTGTNYKWLNWSTNGTYDIQVKGGYNYTVYAFVEDPTNVLFTVATDDPFIALTSEQANAAFLQVTNLYDYVWVDAGGMTTNAAVGSTTAATNEVFVTGTNKRMLWTMLFDPSASNSCQVSFTLPNTWDTNVALQVKVQWTTTNSQATQTNVWGIAGVATLHDNSLDTASGTELILKSLDTGANEMITTSATTDITLAGQPVIGSLITIQIRRLGGHTDDNMTGLARLLGIVVRYKRNTSPVAAW